MEKSKPRRRGGTERVGILWNARPCHDQTEMPRIKTTRYLRVSVPRWFAFLRALRALRALRGLYRALAVVVVFAARSFFCFSTIDATSARSCFAS